MGRKDALPRDEMVDYVMSCWDDEAGMSSITCSMPHSARGTHAPLNTMNA